MTNNRKKPAFLRQESYRMGNRRKKWLKWRRTRGNQSKLRMHIAGKGFRPHPGWGAPVETRGLHPSGLAEVIVMNVNVLDKLDPAKQAIRIGHGVGNLARLGIQKAAGELKIKVLNPKKIELRKKAPASAEAKKAAGPASAPKVGQHGEPKASSKGQPRTDGGEE